MIAMVGFVPGMAAPATRRGPLTPLVVLHALLFTGWLVLYLVQVLLLVSTGRTRCTASSA
jgi:hypothetical protein